jgi:hypothetical protein
MLTLFDDQNLEYVNFWSGILKWEVDIGLVGHIVEERGAYVYRLTSNFVKIRDGEDQLVW